MPAHEKPKPRHRKPASYAWGVMAAFGTATALAGKTLEVVHEGRSVLDAVTIHVGSLPLAGAVVGGLTGKLLDIQEPDMESHKVRTIAGICAGAASMIMNTVVSMRHGIPASSEPGTAYGFGLGMAAGIAAGALAPGYRSDQPPSES